MGSELLSGKVNTHAAAVAGRLAEVGLALSREVTVGDDPAEMEKVFRESWRRAQVVLCTGGLGPTFDDLTRDVWAKVTHRPLRFQKPLMDDIRNKFRRRRWPMPKENRRQTYVLAGAAVMQNPYGTAPGQVLVAGGKVLALFPGPAREFFPMMEGKFLPFLRTRLPPRTRKTKIYRLFNFSESAVDERLDGLRRRSRAPGKIEVTWGILAQRFIIDVKVTVAGPAPAAVESALARIHSAVLAEFGGDVYGFGEETLQECVGRDLRRRKETVSTAESCTGGLVAEKLTRVPGSSDYFMQGSVTYSNRSKRRLLGVRQETLRRHGAVSAECAREMAAGCRRRAGTDWALALTGVAGPSGGTPQKPVGLVYIALAGKRGVSVTEHRFSGTREDIRERSALTALDRLRRALQKKRSGGRSGTSG